MSIQRDNHESHSPRPREPAAIAGFGTGRAVDAWEKWFKRSHYIFYALLVFSTLSALLDGPDSWDYRGAVFVLSLLLGGWSWVTIVKHPEWCQERLLPALAYFAVMVPLFVALVQLHPAYMSLVFFLYWYNFSLLPTRWAVPGAGAMTILVIWLGAGSDNLGQVLLDPRNILIFAGYLIVTGVLSLFMDSIIRQSQERRRLIEELEATREELATEERRAGMLEERGRLAREIHDTLAQGFISIVTHLEAAEEALATGDEAGRMHLDQARRTARESLSEARRVVRALRPELLEGSSLPEALERLAGRWSEETGVRAEVEVSGDPRQLSQELQVTLFRAAQEALTNARKHARAAGVTLTLSYIGDLVVLDVQDDGEGFDPDLASAASEGGFGLRYMRERVERLGGRLLVESSPGEGTTLVIELPVGVEEEPAIADAEKTS